MFSGGPSLSARLANIQHMPVLIAATIASEKPTDGYLVKDIVSIPQSVITASTNGCDVVRHLTVFSFNMV
jgi:hypothetical protein